MHDLTYDKLTSNNSTTRYEYTRPIIKDKYDDYDILDYESCNMDYKYLESYNDYFYDIDSEEEFTYHIVTKSETNRLDIISYKYYDTPEYWWLIALANRIIDPRIVNTNSYLKIPPLSSLFNKNGVLNNGFR